MGPGAAEQPAGRAGARERKMIDWLASLPLWAIKALALAAGLLAALLLGLLLWRWLGGLQRRLPPPD